MPDLVEVVNLHEVTYEIWDSADEIIDAIQDATSEISIKSDGIANEVRTVSEFVYKSAEGIMSRLDKHAETIVQELRAGYTDFVTDQGVIRIVHEASLGDILVFTSVSALVLFLVLKTIVSIIWR